MRDNGELTRIYRGIRRRVNRGKPLDSFPFLSGDSYLYSCEFYFRSGGLRKVPSMQGRNQKHNSLFVKVGDLDSFILFLEENSNTHFSDFTLVLHNGDDAIPKDSLEALSFRFKRILAVNLLEETRICSPIPIGLENRNYFTNGIPTDFKKLLDSGLSATEDRTIMILEAFSVGTNRLEREACHRIASQLGATRLSGATPVNYRKALSESKFVLSPAGNGFDCHRTWEALYLGSIPIVKRAHWPFINKPLPVLIIDEWEDLLMLELNSVSVPRNPTWSEDFWNSLHND